MEVKTVGKSAAHATERRWFQIPDIRPIYLVFPAQMDIIPLVTVLLSLQRQGSCQRQEIYTRKHNPCHILFIIIGTIYKAHTS